jgi:hypothetical protein
MLVVHCQQGENWLIVHCKTGKGVMENAPTALGGGGGFRPMSAGERYEQGKRKKGKGK